MRHLSLLPALVVALAMTGDALGAQEASSPQADTSPSQRGVLFLAVEDYTRPYVRLIFEAFSDELLRAPDAPAIYFESLDSTRFEQKEYMDDVREWLRRKYQGTRIDLVVPISEDGLYFSQTGTVSRGPPPECCISKQGVSASIRRPCSLKQADCCSTTTPAMRSM